MSLALLSPALLLGGCASTAGGGYPSLAKRPIETRFAVVETVPLPLPGPLPTDLAGQLAAWRNRANAADAAFAAALPTTEAAVGAANGAPVASEPWIVAQQALSRLATVRGPLGDVLADVDALYLARQRDGAIDGLPAIHALREVLAAMHAAQDAKLAILAERIGE